MARKTMLFRYPGPFKFDGEFFDFVTVTPESIGAYLSRGWFKSKDEAKLHPVVPKDGKPRKFSSLTPIDIKAIADATGTIKEIRQRFNITLYTYRKIRGGII